MKEEEERRKAEEKAKARQREKVREALEAREAREAQEARARAFRAQRARHEQDEYYRPPFAEELYARQKTKEFIDNCEAICARELAAKHCWHLQTGPFGEILHPCDTCFARAVAIPNAPLPP